MRSRRGTCVRDRTGARSCDRTEANVKPSGKGISVVVYQELVLPR